MMFRNPFAEKTGYEEKTTFWDDFVIADHFGLDAVKDTYKRAFKEWNGNAVYLTELVMVLNWRLWLHYWNDGEDSKFAHLYNELYREADAYALENLKDEDLIYFYNTTD